MKDDIKLSDTGLVNRLYAEMETNPNIGIWEIGARFIEILTINKQHDQNPRQLESHAN